MKQMDTHLVRCWTICEKIEKCCLKILWESWCKQVLLCTKLSSGLSHNCINDIQSREFILRLTLSKHKTYHMVIINVHSYHTSMGQSHHTRLQQEAQLPQRNSASAAHVYLGWLTARAMHRTAESQRLYYFFWHSNTLIQEMLAENGLTWNSHSRSFKFDVFGPPNFLGEGPPNFWLNFINYSHHRTCGKVWW